MTTLRLGLLQLAVRTPTDCSPAEIRAASLRVIEDYANRAAARGVQVLALQELCNQPYFPPSRDTRWHGAAERIPDGPSVSQARVWAARHKMVLVLPVYEEEAPGIYYNSAAVIDADGSYLGKYRKVHIPDMVDWPEKFFFRPGNLGFPVFKTTFGRVGVYICYDRHFPEGFRALALAGAELVVVPTATGPHSRSIWEIELKAAAIANSYFVAGVNRVGKEAPWNIAEFYGASLVVNPNGEVVAQGGQEDELVVADLDLDLVRTQRSFWQFYRDRRPELYGTLADPSVG